MHVLYDAANDILYRPHPHLVVAEEEGNEKPCFSGEKEAETPIYSNSDDDSEIFRTPPTSPAPTHEVS